MLFLKELQFLNLIFKYGRLRNTCHMSIYIFADTLPDFNTVLWTDRENRVGQLNPADSNDARLTFRPLNLVILDLTFKSRSKSVSLNLKFDIGRPG